MGVPIYFKVNLNDPLRAYLSLSLEMELDYKKKNK